MNQVELTIEASFVGEGEFIAQWVQQLFGVGKTP